MRKALVTAVMIPTTLVLAAVAAFADPGGPSAAGSEASSLGPTGTLGELVSGIAAGGAVGEAASMIATTTSQGVGDEVQAINVTHGSSHRP